MNVLNSLPLWGSLAALGIALPILLHLLNKARPKKVSWAAMELIQRTSKNRARKIKLEDWLIMALRCLALFLAALAMMRLVFTNEEALSSVTPRELILVLDASYSMNHGQFESRFDLAKKRAVEAVESLPVGSKVSLIAMGRETEVLFRHGDPEVDDLKRRLDSLHAQPVELNLAEGLSQIESLVEESDLSGKEVLFLTDGQKQSWDGLAQGTLERLSELSKAAEITVFALSDGSTENLSVSDLQVVSGVRREGGFASLSASVKNHGQSPASTSLSLTHDGEVVDVLSVGPLAPGESQLVRLGSQLEVAGSNRFRVSIDADHLVDDNTAYLAIEVPDQLKVLVVEGREREARYLDLALRLRRSGYAQGLDCVTVPSSSVGKQDVETAEVVVLANVADLSDDGLESLTECVLKGTGLIVYAGDQMDDFAAERILGRLMPLSYLSSVEPESGESHRLRMDGPPNRISRELSRLEAELSECIVRGYHDLKPSSQANVVLSLSNGKPLLLTQKAGKGKVAFFASGPGRQWNTLPLNPVGPILLHLLLDELRSGAVQRTFQVGESMEIEVPAGSVGAEAELAHPGGQRSIPRRGEGGQSEETRLLLGECSEPGFYELDLGANAGGEILAANLNRLESSIGQATPEELKASLQSTGVRVAGQEELGEGGRQHTLLASFLGLGALLLMIFQAALSTELTRRKQKRSAPIRTGFGVGVNTD